MLFVSYFPLHKGTVRNLVCSVGIPSQWFATCSFAYLGVLRPTRDWPTLLGVVAASVVGVWLGDALHRRVNSAAVASATLLLLSVASVQMLSTDLRIRLTLASMLALVAARVHRETLAVYLSQSLLTALAPTVSITKLDGVAGRRRHDADEVKYTTSTSSRCAAGNLRQRQPQQRRRLQGLRAQPGRLGLLG